MEHAGLRNTGGDHRTGPTTKRRMEGDSRKNEQGNGRGTKYTCPSYTVPHHFSSPALLFPRKFSQVPHSGSRMSRTELKEVAHCFATCLHLSELCSSVFHAHTQLIASLYADEGLGTEENKITSGGARGATQTPAAT